MSTIEINQLIESLSEKERDAITIVKTFIGIYTPRNGGDGDGLFSGVERYRMLADRLPQAAISSQNLFDFWAKLRQKMRVSMPTQTVTEHLIEIWNLPNQLGILNTLTIQANEIIQVALAIYRIEAKERKDARLAATNEFYELTGENH